MAENTVERKLRAILAADVKGYSKMMGEDEVGTYQTLTVNLELIRSIISDHKGRIFSSPGDAVMAEFSSVVDAVECAVEFQNKIEAANTDVPDDQKMQFRIGVNLGDVIHDGEQVYGDGVNIAARIETLAEPGGVSIARNVYDQVQNKLKFGYEYQGEHQVKNINEPVRVYKVLTEPDNVGLLIGEPKASRHLLKHAYISIFAVLTLIVAVAIWQFYPRAPEIEPASVERMAYPLPDKPSIAVLPFDNISDDPKQEFFSDGLTEQIITSLSKVHELFVIARNSTFTYKRKPVKVQEVAEDLGVRYVLEGSVRKSEDNLRVTVQLIDALKGHYMWAEQYDRKLEDLFAVQDEITMQIIKALQIQLTSGPAGFKAKSTQNLQAYLKFLKAVSIYYQYSRDGNVRARQLVEEVIEMDPNYATAYAFLGIIHQVDIPMGLSKSPQESLGKAIQYAKKAQSLDENDYVGYIAMVGPYIGKKDYDNAIKEAEKAISVAPGAASPYASLGHVLCLSGNSREAIDYLKKAIRIEPFPPPHYYFDLGYAYFLTGNYEEAVMVSKKACALAPDNEACHRTLAAAYGMLGKEMEARAEVAELFRIVPDWSIEDWKQRQGDGWKNQADVDHFSKGLRKAGLPDKPPLPLSDKPSIAVLPFRNISGDFEQQYFSDGITEQIITSISKVPYISVIARQSSFAFQDKQLTVKQIAKELDARYILEGSLQRSGERLRINVQLIDATSGHHLWAENYDRKLDDIFSIQDDICKNIMVALQIKLTEGEMARINADTVSIRAYEKYLNAMEHYYRRTKEDSLIVQQLLQEAIALDPEYGASYILMGWAYLDEVWLGMIKTPSESIAKAEKMVQKATAKHGLKARENGLLCGIHLLKKNLEKAIAHCERAIEQSPNNAGLYNMFGVALRNNGQYEEAISSTKKALQLNPFKPINRLNNLAWAYLYSKQYEKAISTWNKTIERNPDYLLAYMGLTSAYWLNGSEDQAREAAQHVLKIKPNFSVGYWEKRSVLIDKVAKERMFDAWRKAGLK